MYPKMLYYEGWDNVENNVVVNDSEEEKTAKAKGFKEMEEFTNPKPRRGRKPKEE